MTLIAISLLRPTGTYFQLDRSFPTYTAHFPSTITSASLRRMILSHGPCRPSDPFEEDGSGRPQ